MQKQIKTVTKAAVGKTVSKATMGKTPSVDMGDKSVWSNIASFTHSNESSGMTSSQKDFPAVSGKARVMLGRNMRYDMTLDETVVFDMPTNVPGT